MQEKTILIDSKTAKKYQKILDIKEGFYPDAGEMEVLVLLKTSFGDGIEADIKICNGDTPFVDPVIFQNGQEIQCLEVRDKLVGAYIFEFDGEQYKVKVKSHKKEIWE